MLIATWGWWPLGWTVQVKNFWKVLLSGSIAVLRNSTPEETGSFSSWTRQWLHSSPEQKGFCLPPQPPLRDSLPHLAGGNGPSSDFSPFSTYWGVSAWSCWPQLIKRLDWKGKKKPSDWKLRITPTYFITGRSFQQLPPGNYKGKSLSKKWGRDGGPREAQMQWGGPGGRAGCLLGHLTRFLFFKVSFSTIICWP